MDNTGLNGKFGAWLKRTIAKAIDTLAFAADGATFGLAHNLLANVVSWADTTLEDLTGGSFWQAKGTFSDDIELTAQEESILDNWYDTKFQPFYLNLVQAANDAYNTENEALALQKINVVLKKVGFINQYYRTNETAGLSQNAINARMQLLGSLNKPLVQEIENEFGAALTANYTANQSDFTGLITANVQGMAYSGKIYPIVVNTPGTTTPGTTPPSNNNPFGPIAVDPIVPTGSNTSGNIKGDAFIAEAESELLPETAVNTTENKNWWKWILGAAAVAYIGNKVINQSK